MRGLCACAVVAAVALIAAFPAPASEQAAFQQLAEQGLAETQSAWWNADKRWYRGSLTGDPSVASMWWSFPLLELSAAVAISNPTKANKQRVDTLFTGAEGYWDKTLGNGTGGVSAGWRISPSYHAFFDDAGWWGVAYLDAYRATGNKRWLTNAQKALTFIDRFGWDRQTGGGVWWDTFHQHKTSEPLAAGALIASTLYRIQHKKPQLEIAKRYLAWADTKTRNVKQDDLYGRSDSDGTVMDYVQGMMIAANVELCAGAKTQSYCTKAEQLADASLKQFPYYADWAPETDVVYLRGLLRLYERDHNLRWYKLILDNAERASSLARDEDGSWSRRWDGGWTQPGVLYTQAATLELFAWAAVAKPPA
jgi:glycosyl hydrolase family 76